MGGVDTIGTDDPGLSSSSASNSSCFLSGQLGLRSPPAPSLQGMEEAGPARRSESCQAWPWCGTSGVQPTPQGLSSAPDLGSMSQQLSKKLLHFSGPELTAWWLPLWGCVCATVVCRAAVPRGPLGRNGDSGAQLLSPSALGGLAPQLEPTLQQRGLLASGSPCCPAALTQWLLCLCTPSPGARVTLRSLALWPLHVGSMGLGLGFRSPASLSALAGH